MANAPFDYKTAQEMFDYIASRVVVDKSNSDIPPIVCDGSLANTLKWLSEHFNGNLEKIDSAIDFLMNNGGFCDCEVLMNASKGEYWM